MNGWNSGRVWKRQPLARFTSSTPRAAPVLAQLVEQPSQRVGADLVVEQPLQVGERRAAPARRAARPRVMRFASVGFGMGPGFLHVDRREAFGLGDLDQHLARELEQREEASPPAPRRRAPGRTARRTRARAAPAAGAGCWLMCSRTDSSSRVTWWCWRQARARQQRAPGLGQVLRVHVGQPLADRALDPDRDREHVAPELRQRVELLRRLLHALVLEQAAHQLGARVVLLVGSARGGRGSSMRDLISISIAAITRYSAASSRFLRAHHLDVLQVLARERRHRDVEDVEVLPCGSGTAAGRAAPRRRRGSPRARPAGCRGPRGISTSGSP